ncbi:hypothetical protein, partial [Cloacibacillus sp. An23]|uniref:hypothetical protein n=1 Tax=Cloacibacillus sp. An23 TaxID=1965591 RepID=UPI00195048AD
TIILTGLSIEDRAQVWASYSYTPPAAFVGEYDIYISKALAEDTSKGRQVVLGTTYYSSGTLSLWSTGRSAWNYHPGDCVRGVSTTADKIYTINTATIRVVAIGKWK